MVICGLWVDLRLLSPPILACVSLVLVLSLAAVYVREEPISMYVMLEERYVPGDAVVKHLTVDPFFRRGLEYWGISTPGGGSTPVYFDGFWLMHARDYNGSFAYSSILQGCKPYFWGCGNYSFDPVPASSKLYLTVSFTKRTIDVYRGDGFAGALVDLWFENFRGDSLVVDLYLARDVKNEDEVIRSAGKGFVYAFTSQSQFGKTYHFNIVLTEAKNGELVYVDRLLLEPIIDMAFETFRLNRSEWWLVSVDAGSEAHYSEIYVYLYCLEVGVVVEE